MHLRRYRSAVGLLVLSLIVSLPVSALPRERTGRDVTIGEKILKRLKQVVRSLGDTMSVPNPKP